MDTISEQNSQNKNGEWEKEIHFRVQENIKIHFYEIVCPIKRPQKIIGAWRVSHLFNRSWGISSISVTVLMEISFSYFPSLNHNILSMASNNIMEKKSLTVVYMNLLFGWSHSWFVINLHTKVFYVFIWNIIWSPRWSIMKNCWLINSKNKTSCYNLSLY